MSNSQKNADNSTWTCKVCHKEIPDSAALSAEGKDYTWHFCGRSCYDKWASQEENKKSIQDNPDQQNTG